MVIKPPVIVYNWGDVEIFRSVSEAQTHLESMDVDHGEYLLFDSEGHILESVSTLSGGIVIRLATSETRFVAQTRKVLLRLLSHPKFKQTGLEKAPLEDLVQKALDLKRP